MCHTEIKDRIEKNFFINYYNDEKRSRKRRLMLIFASEKNAHDQKRRRSGESQVFYINTYAKY